MRRATIKSQLQYLDKIIMGHCVSKQHHHSSSARPDARTSKLRKRAVAANRGSTNETKSSHRLVMGVTYAYDEHNESMTSTDGSSTSSDLQPSSQPQTPFAQTYKILREKKLGIGLAGEVHQCVHVPTSQLRAVKSINLTAKELKRKDRIRREIDFLKEVDHPNIIRLHDAYECEDNVHLVTELCHGGELFDRIIDKADDCSRKSPTCFREKDAARIICDLLKAVSYLHSKDIVHRDIKPENILFAQRNDDESPIKLIDFGLSIRHNAAETDEPLATPVGTSYYMAPELLDGKYDRSCDLWSIGVIAYLMLSGRPPFNGPSDEVIMKKIRRGKYCMEKSVLWDHEVSRYGKDFIRRLLEMDPRKRWTADMALEHAWLNLARVDSEFLG